MPNFFGALCGRNDPRIVPPPCLALIFHDLLEDLTGPVREPGPRRPTASPMYLHRHMQGDDDTQIERDQEAVVRGTGQVRTVVLVEVETHRTQGGLELADQEVHDRPVAVHVLPSRDELNRLADVIVLEKGLGVRQGAVARHTARDRELRLQLEEHVLSS